MSGMDDLEAMFAENGLGTGPAPVAEAAQAPAAPVVAQAPTQQMATQQTTALTGVGDDFDIGMSDELQKSMEAMGIVVGDIGTKISKVPIDKYKASTAKVDRISFLTSRVIAVKFHYIDNQGSIVCFGGKCCEIAGTPQVRYLFPVAVYQTDTDGNISGKKIELKILAAGDELYKHIQTINNGTKQQGGIDHVDLLVTCTDDKYQKISLTYAGPAVWRQYKQIAQFLKERWMKDGANAYMAVARKCDATAFAKMMGLDEGGGNDSSAQDTFNPATNGDLSKFFDD